MELRFRYLVCRWMGKTNNTEKKCWDTGPHSTPLHKGSSQALLVHCLSQDWTDESAYVKWENVAGKDRIKPEKKEKSDILLSELVLESIGSGLRQFDERVHILATSTVGPETSSLSSCLGAFLIGTGVLTTGEAKAPGELTFDPVTDR
ncbi:predicted protein [Aspergillus nidulans FGSC A4]|uniref:Uncharacterized protein n=1 Tax=Emericella nidulans (strain FGSC A4 / ATCC 38163 / CBS 112.46 / NRRL 194 / M139) TaxID=227321 RepID=Q5B972_EMENI|nr:hypothetical protein [Aspergillus nidulans FGSC A4]EAA63479.1 predicted protein [Aspergillus nidulans FGSC A4]CBF83771.1 TPA: conserved hypothetical protein [Aspergillus nidulans FGSC A4]|eukprot:XP_660512.1 predicted protein [Aspergillus nidulans FGSC A4]